MEKDSLRFTLDQGIKGLGDNPEQFYFVLQK